VNASTSHLESAAGLWGLVGASGDDTWMAEGACAQVDPDLHFPLTDAMYDQIADAKKVCAGCPVLAKCREYGFTQSHGIWGGLTVTERRSIRRRERARERDRELRRELVRLSEREDTVAAVVLDELAKGA
jgi:WhiB family redox-sensing transcriptional regulator